MIDNDGYTYVTRGNGEVDIFFGEALELMLAGDDAASFLADVKDGDAQAVMRSYVKAGGKTSPAGTTDKHPASDDLLPEDKSDGGEP